MQSYTLHARTIYTIPQVSAYLYNPPSICLSNNPPPQYLPMLVTLCGGGHWVLGEALCLTIGVTISAVVLAEGLLVMTIACYRSVVCISLYLILTKGIC